MEEGNPSSRTPVVTVLHTRLGVVRLMETDAEAGTRAEKGRHLSAQKLALRVLRGSNRREIRPLPGVTFQPINRENFDACINLSVNAAQQNFVASNLYSLAQAKVQHECVPLAVYEGETMVGFLMYAKDATDQQYWVYRLMIDQRFQGRGLGGAAMRAIMDDLCRRDDFEKLRISFQPENLRARHLYETLGFRVTGEVIEGEIVMEWAPSSSGRRVHDAR